MTTSSSLPNDKGTDTLSRTLEMVGAVAVAVGLLIILVAAAAVMVSVSIITK